MEMRREDWQMGSLNSPDWTQGTWIWEVIRVLLILESSLLSHSLDNKSSNIKCLKTTTIYVSPYVGGSLCCALWSILLFSDELYHVSALNCNKAWLVTRTMGVTGPCGLLLLSSLAWDQSHGRGVASRERAEARVLQLWLRIGAQPLLPYSIG